TALCLWLEPRAGGEPGFALRVAAGGHPLPYRLKQGAPAETVGRPGALLGAFEGAAWPEAACALAPGEALVLFTDGVPDSRGAGERFGQDRLEALLATLGGAGADEVAGRIDEALLDFQDGPQRDDVAVLVLRATA
ncbi:MAG TPA: PP2C family protein-serine/threonine phosphatase, partial [Solirubrobacteraceae bacterium]|nr:PP2C family protein-serine/threonine phosphatase [Solirubrobacteraceae bacterium]